MKLPKKNSFSKNFAFHAFPADARSYLSVEVPFHHINLTPSPSPPCQLLSWFTQNIRMQTKIHILLLIQV